MSLQETEPFADWIGRSSTQSDLICAAPLARLSATLGRQDPEWRDGDALPPLWHWLFFTPRPLAGELGPDGHAQRGEFLPPVPLPRRMWAGGRFEFHHALRVGAPAQRRSRVVDVRSKSGRSGELVFVTVEHQFVDDQGLALTEWHEIVYRDAAQPGDAPVQPPDAPTGAEFAREFTPDPVLLFRYSALTFNGHRIHYDRSYATQTEGYPGLVVHGPLIATLLVELLREQQPGARLKRFAFKAVSPLFDTHRFQVKGCSSGDGHFALWASNHQGLLAMQAQADIE